MKVRLDFVTNSSSSSFIISRDSISYHELLTILLEIANKEAKKYDEDTCYGKEYIKDNCVCGRYIITVATPNKKYMVTDSDKELDNHYIIENDDCGRYDWDVIKSVLDEYNIEWECGYCD